MRYSVNSPVVFVSLDTVDTVSYCHLISFVYPDVDVCINYTYISPFVIFDAAPELYHSH